MYCEGVFPEIEVAFRFSREGQFLCIVLIDKSDGSILDESNLISVSELCLGYNVDKPVFFTKMWRQLSEYLKRSRDENKNVGKVQNGSP